MQSNTSQWCVRAFIGSPCVFETNIREKSATHITRFVIIAWFIARTFNDKTHTVQISIETRRVIASVYEYRTMHCRRNQHNRN